MHILQGLVPLLVGAGAAAAELPGFARPIQRSVQQQSPACNCRRCDALQAGLGRLQAELRDATGQHLEAIRELERRTHELRSQLGGLGTEVGGLAASAGEALKRSGAAVERVDRFDLHVDQWESSLRRLDERLVAQEVRPPEAAVPGPAAPTIVNVAARRLLPFAPVWLEQLGLGAALGGAALSPPLVALVALRAFLGWRRRNTPAQTVIETAVPVAVDSPPPPQRIVPETRFVRVERDSFHQAYEWAKGEYVRKAPGAEGTMMAVDSLIHQYLGKERADVRA